MNIVSGRRLLQQDYQQFYLQHHDPNVVTFEVVPCNGIERRDIVLTLEDGAFFQGEVWTSKTIRDTILAVVEDSDPVIAPLDTLASRLEDQLSQRLDCSLEVVNVHHVFQEVVPEKSIFAANQRSLESVLEDVAERRALSSPPSSMDLRNQIPGGVRNQGRFGTCAAFAGATIKAYQEHVDYGFDETFSPRFIYAFRDDDEEGMSVSEVFTTLSTRGALEESKMPYSGMSNAHTEADISQEHKNDALNHQTSSSSYVYLGTHRYSSVSSFKTDFKNAMHNFGVGYVSTPHYHDGCEMWKGDSEEPGSHAMTTVGYDDDGILIQNSWGTWWCDSGYTTVSWSDAVDHMNFFAFTSDLPSPFTLELSANNNWSRRYNKRKSQGWYCTGGWQANWEGRPDNEVVNFDSVQLEVLSAADKTYRVVSEADSAGLMFGTGKDCFAWDHCGASQYRGGFSIDFRGTGYELVSSRVVRNGWGASMYVSQDGAAYSASSSIVNIADGTQRVEASCGGWCGGCQAELVVRPVQ
jgi:C1A family cysteine protease